MLPAPLLGSQELAAVLAAVALGAGGEISGTCSRFVSVSSSFEGVMSASVSKIGFSDAVSASSTGASTTGAGVSTSGSF